MTHSLGPAATYVHCQCSTPQLASVRHWQTVELLDGYHCHLVGID